MFYLSSDWEQSINSNYAEYAPMVSSTIIDYSNFLSLTIFDFHLSTISDHLSFDSLALRHMS
jgi:hypothetical protein